MSHANSLSSKAYYASDNPKHKESKHVKLVCHQCLSYLNKLASDNKNHEQHGLFELKKINNQNVKTESRFSENNLNGTSTMMLNEEERKLFDLKDHHSNHFNSNHQLIDNFKSSHHKSPSLSKSPRSLPTSNAKKEYSTRDEHRLEETKKRRPVSSPCRSRNKQIDGMATIQSPKWHARLLTED